MKKKIALCMVALLAAASLAGCAGGEKPSESDNPLIENRVKLMQFDYGEVALGEGIFKDVYDGAKEYYLGMSVDQLFYGVRKNLHLNTKIPEDQNLKINNNVLGQLISGNARYYAAHQTPELKTRVEEIADAVDEITKLSPSFVDYSCYTYEKLLQGCLDLYTLCGLQKGFDSAKRMVEFAMNEPSFTEAKKQLGDNGNSQNPRELEWYITAEALYNFADVAKKQGCTAAEVRSYTNFAKFFEYPEFWDIFAQRKNIFDYKPVAGQNTDYFHIYSHLNSFNSASAAYASTGKNYYLGATREFYKFMREKQELATGGFGPHLEWILPQEKIVDSLLRYRDSYENQCDTYAVYRLGNRLAGFTGEAQYGNWSEKLLYNSSIASLETRGGYAYYYSDYCVQGSSKKLREDWQWACCAGSRPLNLNEVLRTIYYHDTQSLYVNLFVNSSVSLETQKGSIALTQQSSFPESDTVTFTVQEAPQSATSIKFRKPEWLSAKAQAKVNGEEVKLVEDQYGWLVLSRAWQAGDTVELTLPASLTVSKIECADEYGKMGVFAINYGPVTLAANMPSPRSDPADILEGNKSMASQLQETDKPLVYKAKKDETLELKPFYSYAEGERYYLYMNLYKEVKNYD